MRTQKQWLEYKQLEQIPLTIAEARRLKQEQSGSPSTVNQWLERIWQPIAKLLRSTTEPEIWRTYDQRGNPIWHAHDPITGQESEWVCEDDLRVWLEERYYQPAIQPPLTSMEQR